MPSLQQDLPKECAFQGCVASLIRVFKGPKVRETIQILRQKGAVLPLILLSLGGCSVFDQIEEVDQSTLQAEAVAAPEESKFSGADCQVFFQGLAAGEALDRFFEKGKCGNEAPYRVYALGGTNPVQLGPEAKLNCAMTTQLQRYFADVVQPEAIRHLGQPVVKVRVAASYSCRRRNGSRRGKFSEHAFMNAMDISSFTLADGRTLTVKKDWRGVSRDARFMKKINRGACKYFTTVLGPGGDKYHQDHFHFDLAKHGRKGTYRVCK